jgi:hypothetical protein
MRRCGWERDRESVLQCLLSRRTGALVLVLARELMECCLLGLILRKWKAHGTDRARLTLLVLGQTRLTRKHPQLANDCVRGARLEQCALRSVHLRGCDHGSGGARDAGESDSGRADDQALDNECVIIGSLIGSGSSAVSYTASEGASGAGLFSLESRRDMIDVSVRRVVCSLFLRIFLGSGTSMLCDRFGRWCGRRRTHEAGERLE